MCVDIFMEETKRRKMIYPEVFVFLEPVGQCHIADVYNYEAIKMVLLSNTINVKPK